MSKRFTHPFGKIRQKYARLKSQLPAKASNIAVNEFKTNFVRGGYRVGMGMVRRWKLRKDTGKRSQGRAILVGTGRLKRSLRAAPIAFYARVVTNVPYAKAHNEGTNERVNVKAHTRGRYSKNKVKRKGRNQTLTRRSGNSYVRAHKRKMNLPARPFMITTAPLLREINTMVSKEIDKLINSI